MILGTISAVDDSDGLQLIIDGEDTATTKKYTYVASYVPAVNDRVIIEEVGGSYVIMGKIINDVGSSGIARQADNATNATNAINAVNADNASTADACTGNAATATKSSTTDGFTNQVGSSYGALVTYVNRQYNSDIGYYISDITLGYNQNFVYK